MKIISVLILFGVLSSSPESEKSTVDIVGSTTVAPYAIGVAGLLEDEVNVHVQQRGTHLGVSTLCTDLGKVDIASAARSITDMERRICAENGIKHLIEVEIGLDGIVFAQSEKSGRLSLTLRDVYVAIARQTPRSDRDCVLVVNKKSTWQEVRPDLPKREILVFGPPTTSGTRDSIVDMVMKEGARTFPCLAELETRSPSYFDTALEIRTDGPWVDGGENDHAVAHTLKYVHQAIGIFGFAHLTESDGIEAIAMNGVVPTVSNLANGRYALAHKLYLYVPANALSERPALETVISAFSSFPAIGPQGVLTRLGLISGSQAGRRVLIDTRTGDRKILAVPESDAMKTASR